MSLRISRALLAAGALVATFVMVQPATALDDLFNGSGTGAGTNWNTDSNWAYSDGSPGFAPDNSFGDYAVLGTTNTLGKLDANATVAATPIAPTGAITLGREANSTGTLTISAGTLTSRPPVPIIDTNQTGIVTVGNNGRGYLVMTGGTLIARGLNVGGQNLTTGSGLSSVSLSGNSIVTIENGTATNVNLARNFTITGPNVTFTDTGSVKLQSTSAFNAVITSATAHSTIKVAKVAGNALTGNVILGGTLNVSFSGLATNPAVGQTWNLFDFGGAEAGNFSNASFGSAFTVSGLPQALPVGAAFKLQQVAGGTNGNLIQLIQDRVLVLQVNRDTGELKVTNPQSGAVNIDGYQINSPTAGSLLTGWKGISGAPAGDTGWAKPPGQSNKVLNEIKQTGSFNVSGIGAAGISLGNGFDKLAVDATLPAGLGTNGEDLVFQYSVPGLTQNVTGQVQYIGTKFENNLVLTINTTTGAASLKNDTLHSLSFDGYSILSSTGALTSGGFTGIGGAISSTNWEKTTAQAPASLSETNPHGPLTLAAGGTVSLGNIGSFGTAAAQAGVSLQFIRDVATVVSPVGDYDHSGTVDTLDYNAWKAAFGTTVTAGTGADGNGNGVIDAADYTVWRDHLGATGSSSFVGEDTFRTGVVQFTSGPGAGAAAAVPEPATAALMLIGLVAVLLIGRKSLLKNRRQPALAAIVGRNNGQRGARHMSRQFGFCIVGVGVVLALLAAAPVHATPQGITLTNSDFELPGPVGTKTVAFSNTTPFAPTAGTIPGWTFTGGSGLAATGETNAGVGNETFGDTIPGDSGTEGVGPGRPGNDMLLSTFDGKSFQTSAFNVVAGLTNQQYRLSFDGHDVFTTYGPDTSLSQYGTPLVSPSQVTARLYYGAARTTIKSQSYPMTGTITNFTLTIPGNDAAIAAAAGQPIGVEFDTTTYENSVIINGITPASPIASHGWTGIDNVLLQITGILPGDLNGDGAVGIADYRVIRDHLQTSSFYQASGDLNGDGVVNLNDFRAFTKITGPLPGAGAGSLAGGSVPEPSTLVLVITAGAIAGARLRRQLGIAGRLRSLVVLGMAVAAALLSATESKAVLLAYDSFNDTNGNYTDAALASQNPTIGPAVPSFFTGPWITQSAGQVVQATSLHYLGSTSSVGGSVAGIGRTQRQLATGWDDTTSGTFYLGYQMSFGATVPTSGTDPTPSMGYHALEFFPTTSVPPNENRSMDIGYNQYNSYGLGNAQTVPTTAKLVIERNNTGTLVDGAPANYNADVGVTHLIVLRFDFSTTAASDSISMYLDPTSSTEPGIPSVTYTGINNNIGFIGPATFNNGGGANSSTTVLDELRVGTTFTDVVIPFPVPGDTDNDGDVDLVDYQHIFDNFNKTGQDTLHGDVAFSTGVQGADGKVDLGDFHLWKTHFPFPGGGSGALGSGSVPEPSTLVLALTVAALSLMARSRNRR